MVDATPTGVSRREVILKLFQAINAQKAVNCYALACLSVRVCRPLTADPIKITFGCRLVQ